MAADRRRLARIGIPMTMTVLIDGQPMREMETADISNGGAFLKASPQLCPPVGSELSLQVKGQLAGKEPPLMRARVARIERDGMGVEFL